MTTPQQYEELVEAARDAEILLDEALVGVHKLARLARSTPLFHAGTDVIAYAKRMERVAHLTKEAVTRARGYAERAAAASRLGWQPARRRAGARR